MIPGKSGDSYCPMGPMALPKSALPKTLRLTTYVNGELRQKGTTDDLIFSIPKLIATLSESQTLRPGDVIATGTPAGVGFGLNPPQFLNPGDVVEISVTGLGTLRNKVAKADPNNHVTKRVTEESCIPVSNLERSNGGVGLTTLPSGKQLYAKTIGNGPSTLIFIHGLGGSHLSYAPLINLLGIDKEDQSQYTCLVFDLEGHGLSPTKVTSKISIESYAQDLQGLIGAFQLPTQNGVTVVAHSMGCLIAYLFASQHPDLVSRLVLLGPAPCPLPAAGADSNIQRAAAVRKGGMSSVAQTVAANATSQKTKTESPVSYAAIQGSILSQDPEGYAKACTALAGARDLHVDFVKLGEKLQTCIVTGDEDKISPPAHVIKLAETMGKGARAQVLEGVGHWHVFEDPEGVVKAVGEFLKGENIAAE